MHIRRSDSRRILAATVVYTLMCIALFAGFGLVGLYPALIVLFAATAIGLVKLFRLLEHDGKLIVSQVDSINTIGAAVPELRFLPHPTGWAASLALLSEIVEFTVLHEPKTVVELGSGLSTLYLATMMKKSGAGHVYSIEHDSSYAAETVAELASRGLQDFATVIPAELTTLDLDGKNWTWYDINWSGLPDNIDLLLVDGPPMQTQRLARYPALPIFEDHLSANATVILDDADRKDEQAILKMWLSQFDSFTSRSKFCRKGLAILTRQSTGSHGRA